MRYVTAVNRSSKPLRCTYNGQRHTLPPGKNYLPEVMAYAFKNQNPIMGSDDMYGNLSSLVGIEEDLDDTSPAEQTDKIELFNRDEGQHVIIMPARGGLFRPGSESRIAVQGPAAGNFTKAE